MWIDVKAILYVKFPPKNVSYAQESFCKEKGQQQKIRC